MKATHAQTSAGAAVTGDPEIVFSVIAKDWTTTTVGNFAICLPGESCDLTNIEPECKAAAR
jgi:hypothetical protein